MIFLTLPFSLPPPPPTQIDKIKAGPFKEGGGEMACDEDESMDVDVDRNEVNVDENEMDVHDIIQVEGRR